VDWLGCIAIAKSSHREGREETNTLTAAQQAAAKSSTLMNADLN
jgi:hypothetical protein